MVIWILESSTTRTGGQALEEAIREFGGEPRWLDVVDEMNGRYGPTPDGTPVVFRGSFQAAQSFRASRPNAYPGVLGSPDDLCCSSYFSTLGNRLLNREYVFVPFGDLARLWPALTDMFGSESLFVRPDSGAKAFTGQVIHDLDLFRSREGLHLNEMADLDLCLVAKPRRIRAEYRFVVVSGEVFGGSQYKRDGQVDISPEIPSDVSDFASNLVREEFRPLDAFMLDIARVDETNRDLAVVEANSFSCASLYATEPRPVVRAITTLAAERVPSG